MEKINLQNLTEKQKIELYEGVQEQQLISLIDWSISSDIKDTTIKVIDALYQRLIFKQNHKTIKQKK